MNEMGYGPLERYSIELLNRGGIDHKLQRGENSALYAIVGGKEIPLGPGYRDPVNGMGSVSDWHILKESKTLSEGLSFPLEVRYHSGFGYNYRVVRNIKELESLFEDLNKDSTMEYRDLSRFGRAYLAVFLRSIQTHFLGLFEYLQPPDSSWLVNEKGGKIRFGNVFLYPARTLSWDQGERLKEDCFDLIPDDPGLHNVLYLVDPDSERNLVTFLGRGPTHEALCLSAIRGRDYIRMHLESNMGEGFGPEDIGMDPMDMDWYYPGCAMGIVPENREKTFLVTGGTVEQALSYLINGAQNVNDFVTFLRQSLEEMNDSRILFRSIDGRSVDPFFLQKMFKLSKVRQKLLSLEAEGGPDSFQGLITLEKAVRRGFTRKGIMMITGMDGKDLDVALDKMNISRRLIPASKGNWNTFLLSWSKGIGDVSASRNPDTIITTDPFDPLKKGTGNFVFLPPSFEENDVPPSNNGHQGVSE